MKLARGAAHLSWMAGFLLGVASAAQAGETLTYGYDELGRLVKVVRSGTVNNGASECYSYDAAGNRSNVNVDINGACVASSGGGGGTGAVSFAVASNGPVTEGASSVFTVTKTGTASGSLSVTYATANGTAVAPGDYTAKSATVLTFLAADVTKTVNVTTIDDSVVESAETFTTSLSAPTGGATITTGSATATINDNDSAPTCGGVTFSIASNGAVTEGASSVFTVTKSGTTTNSCTVNYATANGTAVQPGDYTTKSGTLTFGSTSTSQTVNVTTIDDSVVESAETFTMSLSAPSGGSTIGTGTATATINDNDSGGNRPPVAVNDSGFSQPTCSTDYYAVLVNDSDPDGDPLTLVSISGGTFTVSGSVIQFNSLSGTGNKTTTYTISDGHGGSASATLTVNVYNDGSCTL